MDNSYDDNSHRLVNNSGSVLERSSNIKRFNDRDALHHHNDLHSGDVTVEECPAASEDQAAVGVTAVRRASTGQAHNIPYMQLFHHLKQKFPDLKDCDINESIQKFGLDRSQCEAELQQRAQGQPCGYYGPWGHRPTNWSSSRSTPSRSAGDTPLTTPNTPVLSPVTSPFSSQTPTLYTNLRPAPPPPTPRGGGGGDSTPSHTPLSSPPPQPLQQTPLRPYPRQRSCPAAAVAAVGTPSGLSSPSSVSELVLEQRARKERLRAVLCEGITECDRLQHEVDRLADSLHAGRIQSEQAAQASAQRIEEIQEENRRLQSECDQMEGEILQTGEELEIQDGRFLLSPREGGGYPASSPPSPLPYTTSRGPPPGGDAPRLLTPTRTAPPPPVGLPLYPAGGATATSPTRGTALVEDEPPSSPAPRWSCSRCTYDNHPAMNTCEICGAIRMPPAPSVAAGAGGFSHNHHHPQQQQQLSTEQQLALVRELSRRPKTLRTLD